MDEIGYLPLHREQAHLFVGKSIHWIDFFSSSLQIVAVRYDRGSTIMTSTLSFGALDQAFAGDRVLTAAMLDLSLIHI